MVPQNTESRIHTGHMPHGRMGTRAHAIWTHGYTGTCHMDTWAVGTWDRSSICLVKRIPGT